MKDIHGVEHKIGTMLDKRTPIQKSMLRHGLKEIDRRSSSKAKALHKAKHTPRKLSKAESEEKTKNWPTGKLEKVDTVAYQNKFGRAYND